jgi:signal transduction histidine kinase
MQQYSSLPEQNLSVEVTPSPLAVNHDLTAQLWLESSLNKLQNTLNDFLLPTFSSIQQQPENEIFQTIARSLVAIVPNSTVAIAVTQVQTKLIQFCYISSYSDEDSLEARENNFLPSFLTLLNGDKVSLTPGQQIDIKDLELLEKEESPKVWQLKDNHNNDIAWLVIINTYTSDFENHSLPVNEFIKRAIKQLAFSFTQLRQLQTWKQQYQKLEAEKEELIRTNQLKNQFLANTSHEIRTPLGSVIGFTHLLLAQGYNPSRERHKQYLEIINSSSKDLLALINDILDLSKIEANQLEVEWEPVNVKQICQNVLALVKEKAANKGIKLRIQLEADNLSLIADPLRLKQMLLNLLFNAVKFTDRGSVGLQVTSKDNYLLFTIWDTGSGIAVRNQEELFEPYYQVTNTHREEGTGLGLAVTRKLAQLHGGWIEVKSVVNQGSNFTIVLPRTPGKTQEEIREQGEMENDSLPNPVGGFGTFEERQPKQDIHLPAFQPQNILLVEDDLPNGQLIQTYLSQLEYRITLVKNATEMWEALNKEIPVLILLDIRLPDANGLEIIKQIRGHEKYQNIPVIAETAMAMKGDKEICLEAGANEYISKPIDLPLLAKLVAKYVIAP